MRIPLSTVVLGILNAAAAGVLIARIVAGSQVEALQATQAQARPASVAPVDETGPPVDFGAIQAQAVFHKSRSFYVPPAMPLQEQPPPDYRFAGSMVLPNGGATAVLIHNQSSVRTKVASGDQLEGWTVTEVGSKRVIVTLGERTVEIGAARAPAGGSMSFGSAPAVNTTGSAIRVLGNATRTQ